MIRDFLKEVKALFGKKNTEAHNKNKENKNTKEKIWGISDFWACVSRVSRFTVKIKREPGSYYKNSSSLQLADVSMQ